MIQTFALICATLLGGGASHALATERSDPYACSGEPCKVVFTLDENNNLVLDKVQKHHKNEAVLRLTTQQVEDVAAGPTVTNPTQNTQHPDEFADALKALANIPGLGFLRADAKTPTSHAKSATTHLSSRKQSAQCQQAKAFIAAIAEDGTATKMDALTPAEFAEICPPAL